MKIHAPHLRFRSFRTQGRIAEKSAFKGFNGLSLSASLLLLLACARWVCGLPVWLSLLPLPVRGQGSNSFSPRSMRLSWLPVLPTPLLVCHTCGVPVSGGLSLGYALKGRRDPFLTSPDVLEHRLALSSVRFHTLQKSEWWAEDESSGELRPELRDHSLRVRMVNRRLGCSAMNCDTISQNCARLLSLGGSAGSLGRTSWRCSQSPWESSPWLPQPGGGGTGSEPSRAIAKACALVNWGWC